MSSSPQASVDLEEARSLLSSGAAILLDVREQHEWDAGHAAEAVHMPIEELDAAALPTGIQIITTCRSGGRGARAAAALTEAGRQARNLTGGMRGWQDAGLPMETTDGEPGSVE
ncbi:MAG: rhodanese-like domain-containing protein [Pseudonocardiaceae bacterium]